MTQEKKPVKGEELTKRVGRLLMGQTQSSPNKEEEDENYYQKKARNMEAKREYEESLKRLKELDKPPQEPQFQIRGGINVGEIDLQEMQRQREQDREQERQALMKQMQELETETKRLQREMHEKEVESLRRDFTEKMDALQKTIQTGGSQKSFSEQYSELVGMAKELGLEKTGSGQDPHIQLELAKLQFQQSKEDREFKWKMRQDEKQFQVELQKMQDEREFRRAELEQQAKKDEMFASLPQRIGGTIVKGLLDSGNELAGPPVTGKSGKKYRFEAEEGEGGEAECPHCNAPIGIGPTATGAVCANCGVRMAITRKPLAGAELPAEPIPPEEEE